MNLNYKSIWKFISDVFDKWMDDKAPKLGAAVAFYTIFSLAPLLLISISLSGIIFGEDAARGKIVEEVQGLIGRNGAEIIQTAIKGASDMESGIIAAIISLITLFIGATAVFVELQDSLNMVWNIKPKPGRGIIKGLIRDRLISFSMVVGIGFLLLVSLIISAALSALTDYMSEHIFAIPASILQLANIIVSLFIFFLVFSMIFKVLPDVEIHWSDVWMGALVTAVLFELGKYLIGLYLGNSSYSSTYGAAGSLVILLLWVYYSAQIVFLGAEFTQVYSNKFGSGILPSKHFEKDEEECEDEENDASVQKKKNR